ncbi:hypothetical protein CA850_24045 [Micromonospora echinospora]|uniref:Heparin binding hemagglutinin HbhA n=1 Tax=Micromonospora echinospora TaxID=1877 RepID=A0A1C4X133_MICEC|nr:hypothetical protein [Micromonospora echinospora]OZV77293.1 hypothetical protein CA850_24045 [Micromonospora echinospora]SCF02159.1 hypothetical protein GA0070618_2661 [Micromonospora echinospora]
MSQPKTSRIPAPIYAAAGAGDLALEQLRKLPSVVSDLSGRVVNDLGGKAVVTGFELRQKATETLKTANLTATGLREKAVVGDLDLDRLRGLAGRNAAVVLAGAQAAQERALAAYGALVARGERVVGAGVLEAAETVNADIETTEATTVSPGTTAPATTVPAAEVTTEAAPAPTAAVASEVTATPADVAEVAQAKPAAVKRTRATRTGTTDTPSAKLPKATKRSRPAVD